MKICKVSNLGKIYDGQWIFNRVNFEIGKNEIMGIIGRNGVGKTTLLKILTGQETADNGEITLENGVNIGYVAQIPTSDQTVYEVLLEPFRECIELRNRLEQIEKDLSAPENQESDQLNDVLNIYSKIYDDFERAGGYLYEFEIDKVVIGLQLNNFLEKKFNHISSSEQTKVELAVALLKKPALLLLDEPTNHLDISTFSWLERFIKSYKGSVIIVSHDRIFLNRTVTKIFELEDGQLTSYIGNYDNYQVEKQAQTQLQLKKFKDQRKEILRNEESINWLHERGFFSRAKSKEKSLAKIKQIKQPILERPELNLNLEYDIPDENKIKVNNVFLSQEGKTILDNVCLNVESNEKIAIVGKNGVGKSSLLGIIAGMIKPDKGLIQKGSKAKIGFLSTLNPVISNRSLLDEFRRHVAVDEEIAKEILENALFTKEMLKNKVNQLSGGERVRFQLAQMAANKVTILILDEPTNHLDIPTREILESQLKQFRGAIIVVSHDRYFIRSVCKKVYLLENKQIMDIDYS
ncbi:ABC-F family ATP-binding cassette domain-containing protein [Bacillaceae bacterium SIJ1]|uniref:ABC-F family ATP-binding cassette domain-containing protein n=1 Tax=Litoribacterium kuwaitense TaxID=1398745 RepID=UPI0013ED5125|nr:ABC-F family ATP-binding cassette domain-containing protein [Litoribacterium kuwaitense]NGP46899.1 ABC-F family ATP-binding cassette domain-containing protein [Litoribacterium kuwaitense]